jgi:phospholipase C
MTTMRMHSGRDTVTRRRRRLPFAAGIVGVAALAASTSWISAAQPAASTLHAVRHVFVIVLENQGYAATFGNPTADPYLASTLPARGALLTNYYGIGHESNDNYLAMVSGQAPNPQTQADCQYYTDFVSSGVPVPPSQAVGTGCVFPAAVPTVGNQLSSAGLSWKGYMQDMGNIPSREATTCGHPALNAQDMTQSPAVGDGYATRHDPFVYFHSIIDKAPYCAAHVVPLGTSSASTNGLAHDLLSVRTTPNLSFVVPNLCMDGHDYPCTNQPSPSTSALGDMDAFLQTWVPLITNSPAFKKNGLLVVTFDEAAGPPSGDSSSCCGELPGPNSPLPGINGMGGGRTGAVVLSPFVKAGTVTSTGYNHYALLASIENLFALGRLGEAQTVPSTFGSDVFTAPPTLR